MIRFPQVCFSPGDGGSGDGGDGAPDGGGEGHWTGDHAFFQQNPDAAKSFAKYKTADDAFKGAHELMQQAGKPYKFPKDLGKLTDEQRAEWRSGLAKLHGVPEAPDGYQINTPEGASIDDQGITDWKQFAHEHGLSPETAQKAVDFQLAFVDRLNKARAKVIQGMTDNNYKTFLNEDCGGDKELAATTLENIKRLLQTQFTKDGEVDTAGWEKFAARIYHGDRIIELPILRALAKAAQMEVGTGGAPGAFGQAVAKSGAFEYAEMGK